MWLCVGLGLFITTATHKDRDYLDAAVEQGLLISQTGKAKGALALGEIKRQLIAELLDETAPLGFEPSPKPPRTDTAISIYDRPEMQVAPKEPQQTKAGFLERLTQSESSGDSNAEITIADGRRYVGALQFGDARLQDYQESNWLFVHPG
jgi:hypothetical protein